MDSIEKKTACITGATSGMGAAFAKKFGEQGFDLIITGTNLNRMNTYYFSHITYPEMELRQAIRISASYPFVFVPVEFDGDLFIDGGVIDNYPLQ